MPEEPSTSVSVNVPPSGHGALNVAPPSDHKRDFILFACRTFNVITALCLLLCAAAFGMAIVLRGNAPTKVSVLMWCGVRDSWF